MTNKEAIETIKMAIAEVEWNYPIDYAIAFQKAIEALETVERVNKYCSKITESLNNRR